MEEEVSLFEGLDIPVIEKKKTRTTLDKIKNPKEIKTVVTKSKKVQLTKAEKIANINAEVIRILGKQKDNIVVIRDKEELMNYMTLAIQAGRCAVDTETNNSLDPVTCKLMGLCLHYPGGKQAYVPINHVNPDTQELLPNQLTEKDVYDAIEYLNNSDAIIVTHNGKFDYEVLFFTCDIRLRITWDSLIGCKLIDENEFSAGLKEQYTGKIDTDQEKYHINIFEEYDDIKYADIDPEIFALYAATDSMMTNALYEYQTRIFNTTDFSKILNLADEVEMPYVTVNAEMEKAGIEIDQEYAKRLSAKYHKKLDILDNELVNIIKELQPQIDAWCNLPEAIVLQKRKQTQKQYEKAAGGKNFNPEDWSNVMGVWYKISKCKLDQLFGVTNPSEVHTTLTPVDLASPTKLAILLYDILKCPVVNKDKPTATGEEEMIALAEKTNLPICKKIVERRGLVKLITTYIDNIPELAKLWPDGRVRTHFNQYGAKTGRLSSSEPLNFQNIPSHNKEIRLLFKAKEGYRIVGGDFSAQEPRLVAHYSQDENMLNAYLTGKDLYSVIASQSFDMPYEDCLEFFPEGTEIEYEGQHVICGYKTHQNKAGKNRRTQAKAVLLGILYGRGAASVGEQIGKTREEAQEIIDKFFKAFPKVKTWIEESQKTCREKEYVEDIAGRRRRLPDINLPDYTVRYKKSKDGTTPTGNGDFNPFLGCTNRLNDSLIEKYTKEIMNARSNKQKDEIKKRADADNIEIIANGGFKAEAERQCVNARVQGGAATLTKTALISIYNDQRLKDIGAYLINTVHDEILLEVPEENSELCEKLLTENMVESAKRWVPQVPMKCDTYNVKSWYMDEYEVTVNNEYEHLVEGDPKKGIEGMSYLDAFNKIAEERTEQTREFLYELLKPSMKGVTYDQVFNV